jgi:outer membrane protein TolC
MARARTTVMRATSEKGPHQRRTLAAAWFTGAMTMVGAALAGPFVTTSVAHAADAPAADVPAGTKGQGNTRNLTLDQAVALARKGNRNLVVDRARLAQARTSVEQAWNVLFPTLAVQGKYTRNYEEFKFHVAPAAGMPGNGFDLLIQPKNEWDLGASASTLLFAPAAYPALKAAEAGAEGAAENTRASSDSILYGVAQSFLTAAVADEVIAVRDSNIAVSRATLDIARTRFSAGAVTKVDVDRAQLAVLRAEQSKREAELAQRQAYRALATLMGIGEPFKVVPPPVSESEALPNDDLDLVLKLRPEFRAVQLAAREADLERQAYAWRWAPSISGFGNARRFNYNNFRGDRYSWAVGATLDWVIFDGGVRDSQRHLQAARFAEQQAQAAVLEDSIRDDLANGRDAIATKVQAQRTAERSVVLAQETVELTRAQYEAGTATQIDLLQAQDALVAAQDTVARAHFDVAAAHLALQRAAGTFPPR